MQVPYLEKDEIDKIADEERKKHGEYGRIPVKIEQILEFNYRFRFDIVEGLMEDSGVDALLLSGTELRMAVDHTEYYEPEFWPRLIFTSTRIWTSSTSHGQLPSF